MSDVSSRQNEAYNVMYVYCLGCILEFVIEFSPLDLFRFTIGRR